MQAKFFKSPFVSCAIREFYVAYCGADGALPCGSRVPITDTVIIQTTARRGVSRAPSLARALSANRAGRKISRGPWNSTGRMQLNGPESEIF